jgi:hypothetical protein
MYKARKAGAASPPPRAAGAVLANTIAHQIVDPELNEQG